MIDIAHFTPIESLLGGVLLGVAVTLFLHFNGRIAGVSGIVGGLLRPVVGQVLWRIAFVMGLCLSPALYALFAPLPAIQIESSYIQLVAAGLLVGIGTRYGSGCTSGHGICGISRLSKTSILATLLFLISGMLTVFVIRHLMGSSLL